jgi:hypothetical protein
MLYEKGLTGTASEIHNLGRGDVPAYLLVHRVSRDSLVRYSDAGFLAVQSPLFAACSYSTPFCDILANLPLPQLPLV